MTEPFSKHALTFTVILGSIWGLSEAALGMGLRSCAAMVSGAVMTGVALFFLAAGWAASKRIGGVFLMVVLAAVFKMFDALLLSLPLKHGAIGNPIFAFFIEALALVVLLSVLKQSLIKKTAGQALLGALAAVLAVNLFPLVKYVTGVPACVAPGTGYPLSLYYVHFAVLVSLVSVPLGFRTGAKISALQRRLAGLQAGRSIESLLPPVTLVLCLAVIALLRLA